MSKQQILLLVISIVAVISLYQLPTSVVENESDVAVKQVMHDLSMKAEDQLRYNTLLQQLKESLDIKKSINFADSLADLALKYQQIDSAVSYATFIEGTDNSPESILKAAMIYYRSFQLSTDPVEAVEQAKKARGHLETLLTLDPQNTALKNKLAMTLMTTENPMAGVQLLREVLDQDSTNREATLNLGLLAIRSGQFDRAEDRFLQLLSQDSTDQEAQFYLGVCYSEMNQKEEARRVFKALIKQKDADPALVATASNYLKEL